MPPSRPRKTRAPTHARDDLTQISGIGPVTARGSTAPESARTRFRAARPKSSPQSWRASPEPPPVESWRATGAAKLGASPRCPGTARLPERSLSFGLEFLLEADDAPFDRPPCTTIRPAPTRRGRGGMSTGSSGSCAPMSRAHVSPRPAARTRATRGPSFASPISRVRARDPATAWRQPTSRPPWGCN